MKTLYVGMDLGAKVCVWVAIDPRGKQILWGEFKTSEKEMIETLKGLPGEVHLIFEECELAGWAYRVLKPLVKEVVACDPVRNAWIAKSSNKNDKVDAGKLAEMLRVSSYKPVYNTADEGMSGFKRAVQQEMELTEKAKKLKVQIKSQYRREGLHFTDKKPFNKTEMEDCLSQVTDEVVRDLLVQNYRILAVLEKEKTQARSRVRSLSRKIPVIREMENVPGVGNVLGSRFVAYVQTPHRFPTKRGLWRYSRLGIVDRSSDGKPLGRKRLDRRANGVLKDVSRKIFHGAMKCANENLFQRFYMSSLSRTKSSTHARLNTQRKILAVLRAMWRDRTEYRDDVDRKRA